MEKIMPDRVEVYGKDGVEVYSTLCSLKERRNLTAEVNAMAQQIAQARDRRKIRDYYIVMELRRERALRQGD
jgi:hypothetical protein